MIVGIYSLTEYKHYILVYHENICRHNTQNITHYNTTKHKSRQQFFIIFIDLIFIQTSVFSSSQQNAALEVHRRSPKCLLYKCFLIKCFLNVLYTFVFRMFPKKMLYKHLYSNSLHNNFYKRFYRHL